MTAPLDTSIEHPPPEDPVEPVAATAEPAAAIASAPPDEPADTVAPIERTPGQQARQLASQY